MVLTCACVSSVAPHDLRATVSPQVDYASLEDSTLDVEEWVNSALAQQAEGDSIDTHISTMVMKLQLRSQDTSDSIQENMARMLGAVPRTTRGIERIENACVSLKGDLAATSNQLDKVESDTHESIETLSKLHQAKNRMCTTRDTLQEAANWSALKRNAYAHIANGDSMQMYVLRARPFNNLAAM